MVTTKIVFQDNSVRIINSEDSFLTTNGRPTLKEKVESIAFDNGKPYHWSVTYQNKVIADGIYPSNAPYDKRKQTIPSNERILSRELRREFKNKDFTTMYGKMTF